MPSSKFQTYRKRRVGVNKGGRRRKKDRLLSKETGNGHWPPYRRTVPTHDRFIFSMVFALFRQPGAYAGFWVKNKWGNSKQSTCGEVEISFFFFFFFFFVLWPFLFLFPALQVASSLFPGCLSSHSSTSD